MYEEEEGTEYKTTKLVSSIWSDRFHIFDQILLDDTVPSSEWRHFMHSDYHLQHFSTTDEPDTHFHSAQEKTDDPSYT